jgi:hypothetical protein
MVKKKYKRNNPPKPSMVLIIGKKPFIKDKVVSETRSKLYKTINGDNNIDKVRKNKNGITNNAMP